MRYSADNAPLQRVDEWDDFVATRYRQGKSEEEFRNYKADANPTVTEFYRQNHAHQTLDFVLRKKSEYCGLNRDKKSILPVPAHFSEPSGFLKARQFPAR